MRAGRLLTILMTLQSREQVTAPALAAACGVSPRTIYRDIEALSALGIPVYADRGAEGGYRLLDGYRTRLNGLSSEEAEALFLAGLSGPASDLGLGPAMPMAELKLLAALPPEVRASAERIRATFHLDAPAWFSESEQPSSLPAVAKAVWDQRRIRVRYQSWNGERERELSPLGIVLKGGVWYMVGLVDDNARTYRISRILHLEVLDRQFERPRDFDLAAHWRASTQRLESELYPHQARVRLSPRGRRLLEHLYPSSVHAATVIAPEPEVDGWYAATLPVGVPRHACFDLIRLGAEIEVLEPVELRDAMREMASALLGLYHS